jgi:hypothetical protein
MRRQTHYLFIWKEKRVMLSPENDAKEVIRALLDEYEQFLSGSGKAEGTIEAYLRTVRHLIAWVAQLPDNEGQFHPQQLTKTAVELYLTYLEQESFSGAFAKCVVE